MSLKRRLLSSLGLGWMAIVLVLLAAGWYSGRQLIREVSDTHLEYEARLIARQIEQEVQLRLEAMQRLGADIESTGDIDVTGTQRALENESGLLALFDGLAVVDRRGRVIADWPHRPGLRGFDVADHDTFLFQREVGRPYVSEPFVEPGSDTPVILFSVPLTDADGEFAGSVGGVVNILNGQLFERLRHIRLGEEGFAAVMTASGRVLVHPQRKWLLEPTPTASQNPWLDLALDGWEGTAVGPLVSGTVALQAYQQVWTPGWVVGVFLPRDQAFAPLHWFLRNLWLVGGVTVLAMLPFLAWLLHVGLRPLRQLERQIKAVGQGYREFLDVRTGTEEISRVADSFNQMAEWSREAKARLLDRQAFLDAVLASSPLGMFVYDMQGTLLYVNPAMTQLTGYTLDDHRNDSLDAHIHPDDRGDVRDLWRSSLLSERDFQRQYRYLTASGELIWVDVHASLVRLESGTPLGFVGTMKDITEHHQRAALQRWEAEHDPLTGLLNRRGFERRLEEALADWLKGGINAALILFDLDHFKPINDEGGHALGDHMLELIAHTIAAQVRKSDFLARYGGDEFAILLPACSLEQATLTAEKLRRAVEALSVSHAGNTYRVSLSLGVTTLVAGDADIETPMRRADQASYRAKESGRNRVEIAPAPV
ncbi:MULTISPECIES: diguanylate cyclase [unclassified Modicisalibacter]|uniref:sensor domain-containing diguanylate cyclase n=1 Tax=unclassified Modicisalibacter TaxID=2679913 RepID=UPI001CCA850A|nr:MULTISPECIES: diguanylate cyclase [unclassified Modicisalibacter]MBZ9557506.1 diguanylate cyclase [Modicisalibacter sp. R2A 31.J]MBZ9573829.1 diguanylate cyclase [Modicisalibacter sp. MOD 31.J]